MIMSPTTAAVREIRQKAMTLRFLPVVLLLTLAGKAAGQDKSIWRAWEGEQKLMLSRHRIGTPYKEHSYDTNGVMTYG